MKTGQKRVNPQSPLYEAVLHLRTKEECFAFFQDLCTAAECKAMEQRFEVARMLDKGMIYNDILEETGASSATISRVNRSLNDYGTGAYRMVFDRMDGKEE
ncbi:MAG: TrpR-like protein [Oscillospiraceae bacterium]|nr:TrpR-like protein [Oscillospiraceae bacterium]